MNEPTSANDEEHDATNEEDFTDPFGEAVDDFRAVLSTTIASPQRERRIVELYDAYSAVLFEAMQVQEVSAKAAQRYEAYSAAVAEAYASAESRTAIEAALSDYIAAVQEAWSTVDHTMLGPADLASIAEEMQWVATIAQVVQTTGVDP